MCPDYCCYIDFSSHIDLILNLIYVYALLFLSSIEILQMNFYVRNHLTAVPRLAVKCLFTLHALKHGSLLTL